MKRCNACLEMKSIEDFHKGQTFCKPCQNKKNRERYDPIAATAQRRSWTARNRDRRRQYNYKRRGAKKYIDFRAIYDAHKGICGICHERVEWFEATQDHVKPLSKGGLHEEANVQPAHMLCNIRKRDYVG